MSSEGGERESESAKMSSAIEVQLPCAARMWGHGLHHLWGHLSSMQLVPSPARPIAVSGLRCLFGHPTPPSGFTAHFNVLAYSYLAKQHVMMFVIRDEALSVYFYC